MSRVEIHDGDAQVVLDAAEEVSGADGFRRTYYNGDDLLKAAHRVLLAVRDPRADAVAALVRG